MPDTIQKQYCKCYLDKQKYKCEYDSILKEWSIWYKSGEPLKINNEDFHKIFMKI